MIMSRCNDQIDLMIMMYIGNMYEYKILCRRQFPHASAACRQAMLGGPGLGEPSIKLHRYFVVLCLLWTDGHARLIAC